MAITDAKLVMLSAVTKLKNVNIATLSQDRKSGNRIVESCPLTVRRALRDDSLNYPGQVDATNLWEIKMSEMPRWEEYGEMIARIKVDGGHLYSSEGTLCFVPEIDLTRYQAHLRDAYKQGYEAGHEDAKQGVKQEL